MARVPELKTALETIEEISYKPLPKDKELKARYLVKASDDPLQTTDLHQNRHHIERLIGAKLPNWEEPGFQDWFFNRDEHRQKLEHLFSLALDAAQDILLNTDPKVQGARVQVIKAVADLAGKVPKQQLQVNNVHAQINAMSEDQLRAFLHTGAQKVLGSQEAEIVEQPLDKQR